MTEAKTEILGLYNPGDKRMTGCNNCAIATGFNAYLSNGWDFPEKHVRLGEDPNGARADIFSDKDAGLNFGYGFALSVLKNEGLPVPKDILLPVVRGCTGCNFGDNCYVAAFLENGRDIRKK